ncbi:MULTISPECIES: cytochrome-c oxidase, cbb3-type subunit III [unclassified Marinobacter]|jgi:cytochrome c oxidase cbb3-type subunit III|uniref:Cbb3-type cytochrome c oxidase subunit n=2 Tax=Marinobacter TaxID=2742 RepID=A0A455WBJ3_MARNT|nr:MULTISPECIES: cytochrome-c oxidase, cbb3-type subunit III [unclassified Marinobacter]QFS86799.1 Cbb3-type cytochrome c oxidase subunit CcoP2 [Marinobacter sp. THAF197a]QFT50583.1 Cbb3-type cytochrome c oxidase subunit CcoP2 [Marinobacter sp. THAF39]BBJ03673.1 Cbb3-type cytochrome c oxidase subunit [Marinobacter nauticus]
MSTFWSIWISVIVLGTIFGCWWLLWATRKSQTTDTETDRTMGHSFDGIEEYDNPLPKWWFYLFIATCVFALGYLALYPGLGNFKGILGWTSANQWEAEVAKADARYGEIYAQFGDTPIPELAQNEDAMKIGQRLYANNCSVCHGTAARGQVGFPNLTDDDWLWGGEPEQIWHSIAKGRQGNMPAKGVMPNMTSQQVDQVVNFVLSYSGRERDAEAAKAGEAVYQQACAACHGADGTGMTAMGAPNLTDNIWLYGSTYEWIRETVEHGRQNEMPAQEGRLTDDQIQILAAYVYSLSN